MSNTPHRPTTPAPTSQQPAPTRIDTDTNYGARVRDVIAGVLSVVMAVIASIGVGATSSTAAVAASGESAASMAAMGVIDEEVDTYVRERVAALKIPGAAVAVVQGGHTVHLAGYGEADEQGDLVTTDTPFLIGSTSKAFTSTVVLGLVAQGALSLGSKVRPLLKILDVDVPAGFEQVTVGQLLGHTSGLSMSNGLAGTYEVHRGARALELRLRDILSHDLAHRPGEVFEYSNAGFVVLAAVVEAVTNMTFADYVEQTIFEPLHMEHSFATDEDPAARDLATGHRLWFNQWRAEDLPYDPAGAAMGFMGSTAADMARFMTATLAGRPGDPVVDLHEIATTRISSTGWNVPLERRYGMGWFVDAMAGHMVISHSGSIGNFTAHLIMVPSQDLGIAVMSNASAFVAAGHEGQYDLSLGLAELLLGVKVTPQSRSWVNTILAPVAVWALLVLAALDAARTGWWVTRRRRQGELSARRVRSRGALFAGLVLIALAVALLQLVPLSSARYFYPDVGWGATLFGWTLLGAGALRLLSALTSVQRR